MSRELTPRSSLENLKREAKRWLNALREHDPAARARFERALPNPPDAPTLRDIQLALAREHGASGWSELRSKLEQPPSTSTRDDAIQQLLMAAAQGDADRADELLRAHPDIVNERAILPGNNGRRTALHFAIGPNKLAVVDILLAHGADPNIRDDDDNAMPLHFAAERGDLEVVKRLIEHGADPIGDGTTHELDALGWATCFSYAFHEDVAEYLLAHGARHTIFSAVAMGVTEAIREVVANDRTQLDRPMDKTNHRRRPLHLAIIKRQPQSIATLLELGADTEARDAAGLTPLDQAALDGDAGMTRMLIEHGARVELPAAVALGRVGDIERLMHDDPGALGQNGRWRALILRAAERSPGRVVESLLRHGALVNARDDAETAVDGTPNYTPLHAAAFNGNMDAVRVLLAHGADVRARDGKYHATPAGWADYAGYPEIRDVILEGNIDLFDAIAFDRVNRLQQIFDRGGPINQPIQRLLPDELKPDDRMKPWWTPLAYAIVHGKTDAARELLRLGARTTIRDSQGPKLRDLAVSYGREDIVRLIDEHEARARAGWSTDAATHEGRVVQFLTNACPDHHVRGGWSHIVARDRALGLIERDPAIAHDSIYTAVVCGELELVQRMLRETPELARQRGGPKGSYHVAGIQFVVDPVVPTPPLWDPLLYLCFTRLPIPAAGDNAVAIARLLLDHGADPNSYFMAGDSRYSPLTGVIGEGEEARPPHPRRDELTRLLLERGANRYDIQVFYNMHFKGEVLWYLRLIHEQTINAGRISDWADPAWPMIDMGGYGSGARFLLTVAIDHGDMQLATWLLEHGADPNAGLPARTPLKRESLYEKAIAAGQLELANLLAHHGAVRSKQPDDESVYIDACLRLDRTAAERLIARHPEFLTSPRAMFAAAERDRDDAVSMLLDLGTPIEVEDRTGRRTLHVATDANAFRVAWLLIERGANIDPYETQWGNSPLADAIYAQNTRMIELLAPKSADVWNLVFLGHTRRVHGLLSQNRDLARLCWRGTTLLMRLPGNDAGALEMALVLLHHGADATARDSAGRSAAEIAEQRGLFDTAALLRDAESGRVPPSAGDELPPVVRARNIDPS